MSHNSPETQAVEDIQAVQIAALLAQLSKASLRIAELEATAGSAGSLGMALDMTLAGGRPADDLFPAYRIARLLDSTSVVQRRDMWLALLNGAGLGGPIFGLGPHGGSSDGYCIFVRGSGGYGDMLYLSMVVRALYHRFDRARIIVAHEHPGVAEVFGNNPFVVQALHLPGGLMTEFTTRAAAFDVFDLIADVRYAVTYATPPLSRIPLEFALEAQSRALEWQTYVRRDWPFLNNMFAKAVVDRGWSKYDIASHTANLAFTRPGGDFFPTLPSNIALRVGHAPYVTVHNGADRNMSTRTGGQTKTLPLSIWSKVVKGITQAGLVVVQLGEAHEVLIPGVSIDLRGQTPLDDSAMVIKHAQAHVDTEGGLVHLAAAVGTQSVVAFGPTPVAFFGYPQNINVGPAECGDCWWTSRDWATQCPRHFIPPVCMTSHQSGTLLRHALAAAARGKSIEYQASVLVAHDHLTPAGAGLIAFSKPASPGLIYASSADFVAELAEGMIDPVVDQVRVSFDVAEACGQFSSMLNLEPASPYRLSAETSSQSWAFVDGTGCDGVGVANLLWEAARATSVGGRIGVFLPADMSLNGDALSKAFSALPGGSITMSSRFSGPAHGAENRLITFVVRSKAIVSLVQKATVLADKVISRKRRVAAPEAAS